MDHLYIFWKKGSRNNTGPSLSAEGVRETFRGGNQDLLAPGLQKIEGCLDFRAHAARRKFSLFLKMA
jgi:hypothetical protein